MLFLLLLVCFLSLHLLYILFTPARNVESCWGSTILRCGSECGMNACLRGYPWGKHQRSRNIRDFMMQVDIQRSDRRYYFWSGIEQWSGQSRVVNELEVIWPENEFYGKYFLVLFFLLLLLVFFLFWNQQMLCFSCWCWYCPKWGALRPLLPEGEILIWESRLLVDGVVLNRRSLLSCGWWNLLLSQSCSDL